MKLVLKKKETENGYLDNTILRKVPNIYNSVAEALPLDLGI